MRLDLDRLARQVRRRRGSRVAENLVLGYHCSDRPVGGLFSGRLRPYLVTRHYNSIVSGLPYEYIHLLADRGLDQFRDDEEKVLTALDRMGVRVVFVAERPLDDSFSGRSGFGDYCYEVRLPEAAVLGAFVDHQVAAGRDNAAYGVLYHQERGRPRLERVDELHAPRIDFPLEGFE